MAKPYDEDGDIPDLLSQSGESGSDSDSNSSDSGSESEEENEAPECTDAHACVCTSEICANGSGFENNDVKAGLQRSRKRKHVNKSRKHAKKKQKLRKRWRNTTLVAKLECVDRDEIWQFLKDKRCGCAKNCLRAMWELKEVFVDVIYAYRQARISGTVRTIAHFPSTSTINLAPRGVKN